MGRIVEIEDIGRVTISRRRNAKGISIRLKPTQEIMVTIPYSIDTNRAIGYVKQKKTWIIKHLQKLNKAEQNKTVYDKESVYALCRYRLEFMQHSKDDFRIKVSNGSIRILHPFQTEIQENRFQEAIRIGITEALRMEAKKFLPARVDELATKYGFRYGSVYVKNAKTRWGSCSAKNNINLNLHLMRIPTHLRDYVILHELVHTVHKNHGQEYWALLDCITGEARLFEKELKKHSIELV